MLSEPQSPESNQLLKIILRTQIVRVLIIMGVFWTPEPLLVRDICKDYICKGNKANSIFTVCVRYRDVAPRSLFKEFVAQLLRVLSAPLGTESAAESPLTKVMSFPEQPVSID